VSALAIEGAPLTLSSVVVAKDAGEQIRTRRERLGMSVRALATESGVDRSRIAAAESGHSVRPATLGAIEAALDRLEDEMSGPYDSKDRSTSTVTLPSGERVTFEGPSSDVVIDLVEKFLARQRNASSSD
jgi:transcriptional regulator with XRE-family HTH domain